MTSPTERPLWPITATGCCNLNYIQFLREVGVHFSVNRMLAAECYKQRLERGLSFFEMNYMIMQSYDFLELNRRYGCVDAAGRRRPVEQHDRRRGTAAAVRTANRCTAMTFTLLTTSEGKKMGKTEKGALWLDPEKTSPYEFYQYWRNVADADVIRCLTYSDVPAHGSDSRNGQPGRAVN